MPKFFIFDPKVMPKMGWGQNGPEMDNLTIRLMIMMIQQNYFFMKLNFPNAIKCYENYQIFQSLKIRLR